MTELQERIDVIDPEDRIAMVVEHPNGYSALFFDCKGGNLRLEEAYLELFKVFKNARDDHSGEEALADAENMLDKGGYLLADIIYPGLYLDDVVWYEQDIPYVALDGFDFRVENIISTGINIR